MLPLEFLERLDEIFFLLINRASCYTLLDPVMLLLINPFTWIPLCVFMPLFMFVKTGKHGWLIQDFMGNESCLPSKEKLILVVKQFIQPISLH